jgi:lipoyl(octanoyl) transferase
MTLNPPTFALFQEPPAHGQTNMARDLSLASSTSIPALRTYSWLEPTVSMGHFSDPSAASILASGRPLVRRPTGGGLVEHARFSDPTDHTYCLVIPRCHPASLWRSTHLYHLVHQAMVSALSPHFPTVRLAPAAGPLDSPSCFASPVASDVMLDDRKVAGAAQRRSRQALLHQGAIQSISLPSSFWADFASLLAAALNAAPPSNCALEDESLVLH